MEYPPDFPKNLQPPVDEAIAKAEIKFLETKKKLRISPYSYEYSEAVHKLIELYVAAVFLAFAQQALKAGADGHWTGERIRSELNDFLHKLIISAYNGKSPDPVAIILEHLERDFTRRIKESDDWLKLQRKLAALARAQAAGGPAQQPATEKGNGKLQRLDHNKTKCEPEFGTRAAWLADRLRERAWSKHDMERHGGPDHKTVQRVLNGLSVREDVLEKLVGALSKKLTPVSLLDIPQR